MHYLYLYRGREECLLKDIFQRLVVIVHCDMVSKDEIVKLCTGVNY